MRFSNGLTQSELFSLPVCVCLSAHCLVLMVRLFEAPQRKKSVLLRSLRAAKKERGALSFFSLFSFFLRG